MYRTPFETTPCRFYNIDAIAKGVKLAAVEENLIPLETESGKMVSGIMGVGPADGDTPAFSHPFYMEEMETVVIDTRPFTKLTRERGVSITNGSEYEFQLHRAILTRHFIMEDPQDLLSLGELAPLVFCRWLAEAIVRKLGLSPADQVKVTTVTLFYWYSLFRDDGVFEEREKLRIITKLTQMTAIPSTLSMPLIDKIRVMPTVKDYVEDLKQVVDNPRMESLNVPLLYAILGGSWFGFNVKETIAVALEHPPTFLAIIGTAVNSRAYRKSLLGQLVYNNDKRDRGKVFTRNYMHLLGGHLS